MTIEDLRARKLIIFDCVSGSRAYGTDLPHSDTDLKGVFVQPEAEFFGLDTLEQVNDAGHNEVYYELRRFVELLTRNNPNLLELLATPADCVRYRHPVLDHLPPELFLSKLCQDTFAGYALTQIKKARGLNKKILNPVEVARKGVLDFCYVTDGQGATPAHGWLAHRQWQPQHCGLVAINHLKDFYALFYDPTGQAGFRGIVASENAQEVSLSSVPKGSAPVAYLSFNQEGYSRHCKDHREYWEWTTQRNPERYESTLQHGKNYDAKNLMHTLRLLDMAEEIATQRRVIVRRPNRDFLLRVRGGEFSYEELVAMAEEKMARVAASYATSALPDQPDRAAIAAQLVRVRRHMYAHNR